MFANDQSQLDAAETITFLSRRNGVDVSLTIDSAVAYGVSQREQFASGGRYQAGDLIFTLPADVLLDAGIFPKPADQILRADGSRWTLLQQTTSHFANFVRATTRNLAIAHDLADRVDWYEPVPVQSTDAAGHREPSWQPVALNLVARVQDLGSDVQEEFGKRVTRHRSVVWFEEPIAPTHEGQLRWVVAGQTRILEIERVLERDRIDLLTRVECVWRDY